MADGPNKAVVLVSGGLDSAVALACARAEVGGGECYAITFDYGQRHRVELAAAARVAESLGVPESRRLLVKVDLRAIGGSALTDEIEVPKGTDEGAGVKWDDGARSHGSQSRPVAPARQDIPVTYVPARNLIFLSLATAWAEKVGAGLIYLGVNAVDYSGYPDCRAEFLEAFERAAALGTKVGVGGDGMGGSGGVKVRSPLVRMSKAEIIRKGAELGVDFSLTHSCYDPDGDGAACGACDSCVIRARGFAEAGVADPTRYVRPSAQAVGGAAR